MDQLDSSQEVPTLPNEGDLSDLWEDAELWEWAGLSLGREETVRLHLSLRQLLESYPLRSVRFFGKILGRGGDYYVAQGAYKEGQRPEGTGEEEERGGPNRHVFWVCSAIGEPWELLPDVAPSHIVAARKIRRFFTGDLEASVPTFPAFPGGERTLLRTQIARIEAATAIAPKGAFLLDDPEDPTSPLSANPDWEGWEPADLLLLSSWVHLFSPLNSLGRSEPLDEEEEQEEEWIPPLREISADEPLGVMGASVGIPSWISRKSGNRRNSPVWLRSQKWPGAYAWASDTRHGCVYVGWGLPRDPFPFTPPIPIPREIPLPPVEASDPSVEEEFPPQVVEEEEGEEEDEE